MVDQRQHPDTLRVPLDNDTHLDMDGRRRAEARSNFSTTDVWSACPTDKKALICKIGSYCWRHWYTYSIFLKMWQEFLVEEVCELDIFLTYIYK